MRRVNPLNRRSVLAGLLAAPALIRSAKAQSFIPSLSASENLDRIPGLLGTPDLLVHGPSDPLNGSAIPDTLDGGMPRWQRLAIPARMDGKPTISIVVDDMGVMQPGTARAVALPGPLTLAWFPFAKRLPAQVAAGTARGHETLLHMPMQAYGDSIAWTGPDPLRVDLPTAENLRRLCAALEAVPDTVGLNNHMGSVATLNVALMDIVAQQAKLRQMLFLDSLTIGHSVACRQALQAGVPAASRDVFIDDTNETPMIENQLALIEHISRRQGHCIAIGHPRKLTLDALEKWLPTLSGKGFQLWPVSAAVALRNELPLPTPTV